MSAFFAEYARIILFIHVLFAVTWIGGMVAIRFALHPSLAVIDSGQKRLELTIATLNKFFFDGLYGYRIYRHYWDYYDAWNRI